MKKSITVNYIYNLAYQILAVAIPVITTPYISRVLGANAIGIYSFTAGIVSYFGLVATTGTQTYAQREIAKNHTDVYKRSVIFWNVFSFRVICTLCITILYTVFILTNMKEYRAMFIIQYSIIASWIFDISWYFQGVENFKTVSIRNCTVKVIGTLLIFIFVKDVSDLWIYTLILSGAALIGNSSMWISLFHEIKWIGIRSIKPLNDFKIIMQLFAPLISIQLYTVLDKTMLGLFCNTEEVGFYTQAEKIIKMLLTIPTSLIPVLLPRLSTLYEKNDIKAISYYYEKTLRFIYMLVIPMTVGCIAIADLFVPFFFGKGFDPVRNVMKIESLLFIILSTGQLMGNLLISSNRQNKYTVAVTVAAMLNALCNYVFIKCFYLGAIGATVASVTAEMISTIIQIYYVKDLVSYKPILKYLIRYSIPTCIMAIAVISIEHFLNNAFGMLISILVGGVIYGGVLLFIKDPIVMEVYNKIKKENR